MTEFLKALVGPSIEQYPWVWLFGIWILGLLGTIWEYKSHQNVQVTAGWLLLLTCFLAFAVANMPLPWKLDWLSATIVFVGGALAIRRFIQMENKKNRK